MGYASNTSVSEDRSRAEIERMLMQYGATRFGYVRDTDSATIGFTYRQINIQMRVPLPNATDDAFTKTPSGQPKRAATSVLYEQEVRRRWRCLTLAIKSKLVAVENGVATFETEFLPYMVTPNGQTIAERLMPMIEEAKAGAPLQLPMLPEKSEDRSSVILKVGG